MNLISTIVVGLIAGVLASFLMKAKTGLLTDMILGIVGGILGGWLSSLLFGADLMGGFDLTSIIVATIGAIIVIAIYRMLKR